MRGLRQVRGVIVLGDVITAVNGRPVEDYNGLRDELGRYKIGDTVTLTILRDNSSQEVNVRLEAME
ncbi:MAG TPA: PDZ domain-containing protein [Desulfobacteraceae bacterium]|nr:PDZ domain-containing protein [Desulfobacteraceae bacterium]